MFGVSVWIRRPPFEYFIACIIFRSWRTDLLVKLSSKVGFESGRVEGLFKMNTHAYCWNVSVVRRSHVNINNGFVLKIGAGCLIDLVRAAHHTDDIGEVGDRSQEGLDDCLALAH